MITKECKNKNVCSFYASDYHLEMIMIPYINNQINENKDVAIITQKSLKETTQTVISRINIPQKRKNEILKIDWENNKISNVKKVVQEKNSTLFIIGDTNYINKINQELGAVEAKIVDCYNIEDVQNILPQIVETHSKVLNTKEEKEIIKTPC